MTTIQLVSGHVWSEGKYKITGNNMLVDYNYMAHFKDGSKGLQSEVGERSILFYNGYNVEIERATKHDNSEESWEYTIQFAVTDIK